MSSYSFVINYRVKRGSRREKRLIEVAQLYNLQPSCRLFDRLLMDKEEIAAQRALELAQIEEDKRKLKERELRLIRGSSDA